MTHCSRTSGGTDLMNLGEKAIATLRNRFDVTRRFGFVAETSFEQGIAKTVSYFEEHRKDIER